MVSAAWPVTKTFEAVRIGTVLLALVDELGNVVLDRGDGLLAFRRALVPTEIQLDVGGLLIDALGATGRDSVAPEVLGVLHMFGVGPQPLDQFAVEGVRLVVHVRGELGVVLQQNHDHAVVLELLEQFTLTFDGLVGRGVLGRQRDRVLFTDLFELRHHNVDDDRQHQPGENDRDRERVDESRYARRL